MTTQQAREVPDGFDGSLPEYLVFQELTRLAIPFSYEVNLFGSNVKGAIELDFFVPPDLGINIQGVFIHYNRGVDQIARDRINRIQLESFGIHMIFIDEDHVEQNVRFYVAAALRKQDFSRATRGF